MLVTETRGKGFEMRYENSYWKDFEKRYVVTYYILIDGKYELRTTIVEGIRECIGFLKAIADDPEQDLVSVI